MAYMHENSGRKKARDLGTRCGYAMGGHLGKSDEKSDMAMIKTAIREHENQEHGGKHSRLSFANGGSAMGAMAPSRSDRPARSPSKKKSHGPTINIAVAPHPPAAPGGPPMGGPSPGAMMPPPRPPMPPMGGPPPGGPAPMARPMGGPPGAAPMPPGPMGPPAGMPPTPVAPGMPQRPIIKRGGRTNSLKGVDFEPPGQPADVPPDNTGSGSLVSHIADEAKSIIPKGKIVPQAKRGGQVGSGRVAGITAGAGSGQGRLQKSKGLNY